MLIGIFGTGRNGSTLLMRLLDGIHNTYMHPVEANFLSMMNDLAFKGYIRKDTLFNATTEPLLYIDKPIDSELLNRHYKFHLDQMVSDYISHLNGEINFCDAPFKEMAKKTTYLPSDYITDFLSAMSKCVNSHPCQHYAFKTIETPYIDDYDKLFPDMKFIHLIRDPLEMYSSAKRTLMFNKKRPSWYLCGDNLETMIDKRWIPHAKAIIDKCPGKKHFLIRYEDLVRQPFESIKSICEWLELPLPLHPTKQTVFGGKLMKQLPRNPSKKDAETPVDVVSNLKKKLGYEDMLTGRERELIIYKTYSYAAPVGYFKDISRPDIKSLKMKWLLFEKWEFMHSKNLMDILKSIWFGIIRRYNIFRAVLK